MGIRLRVLIAEDSEDDTLLLVRELRRGGYEPAFERVDTAEAMTAALDRQPWDLVLGDYSMPRFSGASALALVRQRDLDVPFICVSGTITEEVAVAAMRAGANDYVTKGQLKRLVPAIERELREATGRQARRAAEAAARDAATLVEHAPVGIYRSTPDGHILSANPALARMLGYDSVAEVLTLEMPRDVYGDPAERQRLTDQDTYSDREYDEVEAAWKRKDGAILTVQLSVRAVRGGEGRVSYYETIVRDVTEQRRLQAQLVQAVKMEAVGRLAGGIAHDFNNLLTAIVGSAELMLDSLGPAAPERVEAQEIHAAAFRAADLTRQLLAFSRQQVLAPKVVDLNEVVAGMERMLQRLIGEDIGLATSLAPDLGAVRADVSQLEQVIVNLAVNARDAMPRGGKLTIETANAEIDAAYAREHGVPGAAGPCVLLAVSDTGSGMDAETQARIFEPFFTTKPAGKGTGLGLATVYGIVKQSGGLIWVYSEVGHGTAFKVYLPRVEDAVESVRGLREATTLRGTETILVVEDQAEVRNTTRKILGARGYQVLVAATGPHALSIADQHLGPIHALVTDVVMPGMSGREAARLLTQARPQMRVLYFSGYTDNAIVHHGVLDPGVAFLQKPFTAEALARKLREVLDAPG
jgi:PAS domain S-box-containing protein